jgi:hypothetical protein
MQRPDIVHAVFHRLQRPSTWGAALLFAAAWLGIRAVLGLPMQGFGLAETVIPLVLLVGTLLLGPVPWQWTGDGAPMAPFLRGLLQALLWNAAWIVLALAALSGLGLPLGPRGGGLMAPPPRHEPPRDPWRELPPERRAPPPRTPFALGLVNLPLVLLMGWFLADRERTEGSERRLQRLADEARAAALQAQMNPHVLFNALSGLSELVHEDPDAAEEALLELSRMLRLLLHHVSRPLMSLKEERELIRSYLTVEKIRLGNLLTVEWLWPEWVDMLSYPPLLLMPLVENAIKHGVAQSTMGGRLRIEASRDGQQLRLRVSNTGHEESRTAGHGMGHRNLEERLLILHPQAQFGLTREGPWTVAELRLPLPEGA